MKARWAFGLLFLGSLYTLLTAPGWASFWGAIICCILFFGALLESAYRFHYQLLEKINILESKPQLDLFFDQKDTGCYRPNTPLQFGNWTSSRTFICERKLDTDYYRIRVGTKGIGGIQKCFGRMLGFEGAKSYIGENLDLTFDCATEKAGSPDPLERNVNEGCVEYLDALVVSHTGDLLTPTKNFLSPGNPTHNFKAVGGAFYVFHYIVGSQNCRPVKIDLIVKWKTSHGDVEITSRIVE